MKILLCVLGFLTACSSGGSSNEPGKPGPPEGRVSIRVEGGQTGGEGSCLEEPEGPITFDGQDVLALVVGRHETTLAHRPSWQAASVDSEEGERLIVEVSARGKPELAKHCSWLYELPVEVKLSLEEPALDVIIEDTLIAYQADVAELSVELPAEVAERLGLVEARTVASWAAGAEKPASFSLWFGADGVRGDVIGGANCGSLVFPAGRSCVHAGGFPIEPDASLVEALAAFDALPALPVTLPDGTSTTLTIERQEGPARLCGRPYPLSMLRRAPISARVRSADARIDVAVSGELIFAESEGREPGAPSPSPEQLSRDGQRAWTFQANGFLPMASAHSIPYFSDLSERQLGTLELAVLWINSDAPSARLELDSVTANATGQKLSAALWVSEGSAQGPSCFDDSMVRSAGGRRN